MSDYKDFSQKAHSAQTLNASQQPAEQTPPKTTPQPKQDQKDKGVQPSHNTPKT
ncbi:hypothetical protein [Acinetobacter sp. ANC 4648]|uniref:hypothetical protein n=1 Tax=Acinetobacter sp. ANC 4648 TaxID=1977875 RepID=UPI00148A2274|nr:hypothetical protein [Acinetobacter sp. ANC 4648]